jgi:hypothetical protein
MRSFPLSILALALALLWTNSAAAQGEKRFRVDKNSGVQVGFQNVLKNTATEGFKPGMWTPVLVKLTEDEDGEIKLPVALDRSVSGEILIETADNDGVVNTYPQKFNQRLDEKESELYVLAYAKVGSRNPDIRISVKSGNQTYSAGSSKSYNGLQIGSHLYLLLGESLPDFRDALVHMAQAGGGMPQQPIGKGGQPASTDKNTHPRYAVWENNVQLLPAQWFGYSAVDLAILPTATEDFLKKLVGVDDKGTDQLKALAEWVRRGGRLVISVSPANLQHVQRLLTSKVWQPALPRVLREENKLIKVQPLLGLQNWSEALSEPFVNMPEGGATIVQLERPAQVEVEKMSDGDDPKPLIVRFPHGMGSIVILAFDVKNEPWSSWKGRFKFWAKVVRRFAPDSGGQAFDDAAFGGGNAGYGQDITTMLHDELDKFDSPAVSFGWVVLFIFIYILVVGPVDYLLLKFVFKRLELTWITFPAVVVTVSVLAYFTAYALKGKELKINKIDLIDIDMRSHLDSSNQPAGATAYGTTWFTILSPRIQNYTIGIEPVAKPWLLVETKKQPPATVSWLGRTEVAGVGGMGRGRSQGLFNRTYSFEADAVGLRDVPIPVWTTKAFTASWAARFEQLPLEVDLHYDAGRNEILTGTIKSNLPFVLQDIGIVYKGKWYPLSNKNNVNQLAKEDGVLKVALNKAQQHQEDLTNWAMAGNNQVGGQQIRYDRYNETPSTGSMQDPSLLLRRLMFYEAANQAQNHRNQVLRALDWSWRAKDTSAVGIADEGRVREAILVARLTPAFGQAEALQNDNDPRLGTLLWLGDLPGEGKSRPPVLQGNLVQYTYIRVVLPVTPLKK